jgi:DNA mismatch repair protein MutS
MALSPLMQQYMALKEEYKDAIILCRLGDFYEVFFEDAKTVSDILDLTLTGRNCGLEERAPMCGIPYHALNNYLPKLIKSGLKVAIWEQLSDPDKTPKGEMVERGVVRVITPGTVIEESILTEKDNNYLAAVASNDKFFAISWLDVSTGEFKTTTIPFKSISDIEDILLTIKPAEIICDEKTYMMAKNLQSIKMTKLPAFQKYPEQMFNEKTATDKLLKQFKVSSLQAFEIDKYPLSIETAGVLIDYITTTQKRDLWHISSIKFIRTLDYLTIDATAMKNLELVESMRDGSKKATLLGVLDKTRTSMGARNLKQWIERPLRNSKMINERLDAVEELTKSTKIRNNLYDLLANIRDLERLSSRIVYGNPNPRDFIAVASSLEFIPNIKKILNQCSSELLQKINTNIEPLTELYQLLSSAIDENSSSVIRDGGFIKKGFNKELDEYKIASTEGKTWLADLEARERESSGIKTLKVGFNKIFGYYIEVSKGALDKVPLNYVRKQTLTTGERFITEELKTIEDKLLGAQDKSVELELKLFEEIKNKVLSYIPKLLLISHAIANLDTLLSLSVVAVKNNYCKPVINEKVDKIEIIDGRHPVVEEISKSVFVPNNTLLDNTLNRTMLITGPNMSGKSTYMRQVALITIMAHIGSFVPAKKAEIAITDRVFTRIGASDDLAYGQSTFMVEMIEVATILQNATYKSLLILDEIGRGTSTFDGLAIARAVIEDVSQRIRCRTLFSTHYHELTELECLLSGIKNYKVLACEKDKGVVFLHKVMTGGTNKSFGIEVAKLAGVPMNVIKRAKEVQKLLDKISVSTQEKSSMDENNLLNISKDNELRDNLQKIDMDTMSPIQAFAKLQELIDIAKRENS